MSIFEKIFILVLLNNIEASKRKLVLTRGFLLMVFGFGVLGLSIPQTRPYFLLATPFTLLLAAILLFSYHIKWTKGDVIFLVLVYLAGFTLEALGVYTGAIFGPYTYGNTLGYQVFNVPLVIGLNWTTLIYCIVNIVNRTGWKSYSVAALGAAFMVAIDLLIEPVAIALDFWNWEGGVIPLQNYVAWFVFSYVVIFLANITKRNWDNPLATPFFLIQVIFFLLLQPLAQ